MSWDEDDVCIRFVILFSFVFAFCGTQGLMLKAGILLLEPHLQAISLWLSLEVGSHRLFAQAELKSQSFLSQPTK
jgi:hypothetical protein